MPKKKEEKSLVPATSSKDLTVPDYLKREETGRGLENVDKTDLVLPRIKLLQPLSPEVTGEEKKGEAGHLFNTLTMQDYGASLIFIPVTHFKSRIHWLPREDGGGILCSAQDGLHQTTSGDVGIGLCTDCELAKWHNDAENKAPECTIYYNFAIIVEGETTPVALSMERTKIKAAKKLLSLASLAGKLDMFGKKYKITTVKEKNKKGVWYNYAIEPVGYVTAKEFKIAETTYESLKNLTVTIEQDKPEEDTEKAPY